tara:strand:- start:675 stop:1325 length:651 start_codon:yes stop_codon:yes gene_type:complete
MINRTSLIKQPNKISYFAEVLNIQEHYQRAIINGDLSHDFVWIGEHELCYTIGKGGNSKNLLYSLDQNKFNIYKINRGGEVTCHMPGQLVVYLIFNLKNYKKDLNWFLRKIEQIIINTLNYFEIKSSTKKGFTGVWCEDKKIASIGIGCKRWVTIHGFALNIDCDLRNFNNIIPCGIEGCIMTKVSDFHPHLGTFLVKRIVKKFIEAEFNLNFVSE